MHKAVEWIQTHLFEMQDAEHRSFHVRMMPTIENLEYRGKNRHNSSWNCINSAVKRMAED